MLAGWSMVVCRWFERSCAKTSPKEAKACVFQVVICWSVLQPTDGSLPRCLNERFEADRPPLPSQGSDRQLYSAVGFKKHSRDYRLGMKWSKKFGFISFYCSSLEALRVLHACAPAATVCLGSHKVLFEQNWSYDKVKKKIDVCICRHCKT